MKQIKIFILIPFFLLCTNLGFANEVDSVSYGAFGKVKIYKPLLANNKAFVIFISGDGGWNLGVVHMANKLVEQGAMVVGVDIRHLLKVMKKENASILLKPNTVNR